MKFDLTIRHDWDVEHKPKIDRLLPSHPMNVRGHLPYWYLRSRFKQYGTSEYDLPFRGIRRIPDHGEALFIQRSKIDALGTTYFGIGTILPYHEIFFRAIWDLDFSKDEFVKGEKKDPDAPWAFRYFDDYLVFLESGNYTLQIIYTSINGYGTATAELMTVANNQAGTVLQSWNIKKGEIVIISVANTSNYFLRITTGSSYIHGLEKL